MHTTSQIGSQPMAPSPSNPGIPAGSQPININQQNGQGQQQQQQQQQQQGGGGNGSTSNNQSGGHQSNGGGGGSGDYSNLVYPALHLHPLNNTFAPKQISLSPPGPQNRIKIGRQTNAKTVPNPSNGYFDSKVLSRMHAEVWSQDNKVFIKDVKSSNGTFINGERLSAEAQESDVFELHSEDMVEFGIDIVGDDNKTIIHHKVACRVYLVITAEDALGIRNDFATLYRGGGHGGPLGGNGVGPGAEGGLRRGIKGNTMSFDHILSRLQSELQKSRETGSELGGLTTTMNDIQETMGGGLPPVQHPSYQHMVPNPQSKESKDPNQAEVAAAQTASVTALQTQLAETQASLASHVDKIRSLEGLLSEHEVIKAEVGMIKSRMEEARREMEEVVHSSKGSALTASALNGRSISKANGISNSSDDFDDNASMASLDTVTQEGEDSKAEEGEKPPLGVDEVESAAIKSNPLDLHEGPLAPPDLPPELLARDAAASKASLSSSTDNSALSSRLEALERQLEEALNLGRSLQSQHAFATDAVRALEEKVSALEKEVETNASSSTSSSDVAAGAGVGALGGAGAAAVLAHQSSSVDEGKVMQAIEGRFTEWKQQLEEGWRKEREDWAEEREQLRKVVKAWDEANGRLEDEVNRESSREVGQVSSEETSTGSSSSPSLTSSTSRTRSNSPSSSRRSKASKRRAAKRHVNPDLRALLYKDSHNSNFEFGDSSSDGEETDAASSAPTDARSTSSSTETSTEGTSSRSVASSRTSPSPSVTMGLGKGGKDKDGSSSQSSDLTISGSSGERSHSSLSRRDKNLNDAWNAISKEGRLPDHPATLPLGAAGIVVMGMAAFILAGRSGGSAISDVTR